jgi:hypothetical protein
MKSTDQEIKEARDADRILNDPLFVEAFRTLEERLFENMRRVSMADIETQHELVLTLQLMDKFRKQFSELVQTGKLAEIQKTDAARRH